MYTFVSVSQVVKILYKNEEDKQNNKANVVKDHFDRSKYISVW